MESIREAAQRVAGRLIERGYETYFAGGCVRDRLLGRVPKDYDLATAAHPHDILALFPRSNAVGAHFGVVIVKQGQWWVEVATFRTDGVYRDGRHPDSVAFASAAEDAQRRDFTVNGLFEHPQSGEIIDHVDGREDLRCRCLRAIGDPVLRFREDALRLMRAVRFAVSLDFDIEVATWTAVCHGAQALQQISAERIRDELARMLVLPQRRRAMDLLWESGLLMIFWPEMRALEGCEQPPQWHPEGDVKVHTLMMIGMLEADVPLELVLAVLLHDIAKPPTQQIDAETGKISFHGHDALGATMAEDMLRRLRFSNEVIEAVVPMVARHMQFMNVQKMRPAKLKRFMSSPQFEQEMELHRVDCASSNGFTDNWEFVREKQVEFSTAPLIPAPLLTGRDLIAMGMRPGPLFGEILEEVQTEQLEGRLSDAEQALVWVRQRWRI